VQVNNLDPALLHFEYEIVVVLLCFLHPHDVVKEQVMAIAGRQPLMSETGTADHNRPELSDLRMDTKCPFHTAPTWPRWP
jgi:hypothetical protein